MAVSLIRPQLSADGSPVHAGFSTREGGLSAGELASLNVGLHVGDQRKTVYGNRSLILEALGRPDATWVSLRQVHGHDVVEVTHQAGRSIEADALWTRDPQAVLAVLVADCVPILMSHDDGGAVAAAHAGWRGTRARIAEATVKRLGKAGFASKGLRAAIGPAIGPCCFEVGAEVADELATTTDAAAAAIVRNLDGKAHADLWAINRAVLLEAGVPEDRIEVFRMCTSCNAGFYSHRRDAGKTGRQAGVIALAGE